MSGSVLAGIAVAFAVLALGLRTDPDWTWGLAAPIVERSRRRLASASRAVRPEAELPLLLDLLASATSAGLSPILAFRAAADALPGPLGAALAPVSAEALFGGTLVDGVREVARRLSLPDLERAGRLLERSGSLGTPLSVALRELAADHRRDHQRRAEQRARTAPVRMLFPLVFLILPAFLLLTVVPMLLATLRSLG
ncbi:MAG: type II secretion system F family protein [Actinomycetota bacterium]